MKNLNLSFSRLTIALGLLLTVAFTTAYADSYERADGAPHYFNARGTFAFKVDEYAITGTPRLPAHPLECTITLLKSKPIATHLLINTQNYTPAGSAARNSERDITEATTTLEFYQYSTTPPAPGVGSLYVYFNFTSVPHLADNPIKLVCKIKR